MVAGNTRVEIFKDHVVKRTGDPARAARKYAAVHQVAEAHGFVAPRVIEASSTSLVLQRMSGMSSLDQLYLGTDRHAMDEAIGRAGEVLGLLHKHLPTGEAVEWWPATRFMSSLQRYLGRDIDISALPKAVLHGDFSFANVWAARSDPQSITIIDPCANIGCTFDDWTIGPIYLDVGKMLACLEGQIPLRKQYRRPSSLRIAELQERFIQGYERCGVPLDIDVAHAFAFAVSSAQSSRRFGLLAAFHRIALYNGFRRNFPASRKRRSVSWSPDG